MLRPAGNLSRLAAFGYGAWTDATGRNDERDDILGAGESLSDVAPEDDDLM